MSTAAQILANRENAQHSTGPRTEEGKANSSLNNLHHGLAARGFIVLPGQESAFEDLEAGLRACLTARFKNRSSQASSKPPGTSTAAASPRPNSTRIPSTPPPIPYSTTSKPPSTPAFKNTPAKTKARAAEPSTNSAAFRRNNNTATKPIPSRTNNEPNPRNSPHPSTRSPKSAESRKSPPASYPQVTFPNPKHPNLAQPTTQ